MIQKRILVTARYVSGTDVAEGGSSRFMRCVADALIDLGHQVVLTNKPENFCYEPFDLIVCSHQEKYNIIRANPAPKLFISHGIIPDEAPPPDAEVCISVSEETQKHNRLLEVNSRVIGQPIRLNWHSSINETLQKILVIRRYPVEEDPFKFLTDQYDLRYSDPSQPIEDQIDWADLCITLGRGALEAMAQGRLVLVADNRGYIGPVGDGYVDGGNIREITKNNFSGRRFRYPLTRGWIESQLQRYNPRDVNDLFDYLMWNHRADLVVQEYLNYAR
jgi:hypothetical protein